MDSSTPILGTVRASSWGALFDCPLRFYYQNILGLRIPSSGAAALGTAIHAGTAVFDKARIEGKQAHADEAVDATVQSLREPKHDGTDEPEEVAWDDDLNRAEAEKLGITLTAKYCTQTAPTREYAAVELKCESLHIGTEHGVVRVTGTTDRVRRLADGRLGISDLKSGKRATEKNEDGTRRAATSGHHMQLGIYTLMAEQASGRPIDGPAEIIALQTTKDAHIATGEIADVRTALLGTDELPGMITIAAKLLKDGVFPPNPKSMLCSAKYCAGHARCPYHN